MDRNTISHIEIGAAIRERRLELGLTQTELANQLNVTCQQVQRYESGRNRLNAGSIQNISRALGVRVSYFFRRFAATNDPARPLRLTTTERAFLERFRRIENNTLRKMVVKMVAIAAREE